MAPPGQNPALLTSCEYASRVTRSAQLGTPPGCGGAVRPENRVQARSKLPQKKWTGLTLPTKVERKAEITRVACTSCPQNRRTAAASYEACPVSSGKGTATGISTG